MKKILTLLMIVLLMGLTACGEKVEDLPLATQEDFEEIKQDNPKDDANVVVVPGDTTDVAVNDKEDAKEDESVSDEEEITYWELFPTTLVTEIQYQNYGNCYGGVMPIKQNDLWGLMNIKGEVVCEPKYQDYWWAPNYAGYSVFKDNSVYYILDKNGKEVFVTDKDIIQIAISDNDKIMLYYYDYENDGMQTVEYLNVDGTLIYKAVADFAMTDTESTPQPFNEGVAVANARIIRPNGESIQIPSEGWGINYWEISPCANGYYVGLEMDGYRLVDADTGKSMVPFWPSYAVEGLVEFDEITNAYLTGYYKNGTNVYNYKNYGCISVTDGERKVKALFEYNGVEESSTGFNKFRGVIVYDDILFDDYEYLAVKNGDKYFYIDYSGTVKSEEYVKATRFSTNGYAAVLDETNTVHILNNSFEVVQSIENATDLYGYGDAFIIVRDGQYVVYAFEPTNN